MNSLNRTFSNNLNYYIKKYKKTQKEICIALKINTSSMSDYCKGKQYPRPNVIQKLADYFNISTDDLITDKITNAQILPKIERPKYVKIPVLGYIHAGEATNTPEHILGFEEITEELAKTGDFFGLKIKGDSMYPDLKEDDIVIVKKQSDVDSNSVVVALIDGTETTVKVIKKYDDAIALVAINPAYDNRFFTDKELNRLSIIGKVIESRRKFI